MAKTIKMRDSHATIFQYNAASGCYMPVAEYGTQNGEQMQALSDSLEYAEYVTVERHERARYGNVVFDRVSVDVIITGEKARPLPSKMAALLNGTYNPEQDD